jgi:predicted YcjX-like family ATPase
MKRLKTELNALVNRGVDRHLRLAVTGLSRSGKTAFITALVNQLLNIHTGARLPLLSAAREERLLGVKRVPQRDFGIPRFTYDEGLAQLYGQPPMWPTPTRGVSEIRLALRYRSNDSLLRHFKDTSTLYLEIVDYPGEWLLDLPMLAQDYLSWSRQMTGLLQTAWRVGPLAAAVPGWIRWPPMRPVWRTSPPPGRTICTPVSAKGCTLSSPGALSCPAKWPARRRCSFSLARRRRRRRSQAGAGG